MALHPYDLFDVRSLLNEEERAVQESVARFTNERVLPIIGDAFDQARARHAELGRARGLHFGIVGKGFRCFCACHHILDHNLAGLALVAAFDDDGGRIAAVRDIDSPLPGRFTESDELGLRALVSALEENIIFA